MSRVAGFVLIAAGVAAAAYVLPPGDLTEADFARVADASKAARPGANSNRVVIPPEPKPAISPVPPFSAPVIVTLARRPSEPAKAAPIPRDRDAIGRELQKELRRVGCYDGELNGAWTTSTRQAMKSFMDRVNASLPIDEPDSILLTMVRGYQDRVCGKPCPAGQGLGDGGRCVPNAILVRAAPKAPAPVTVAAPIAASKSVPATIGWTTTTTASAQPTPPTSAPPPEGLMALAGPPTDTVRSPSHLTSPAPSRKPTTHRQALPRQDWVHEFYRRQSSQW